MVTSGEDIGLNRWRQDENIEPLDERAKRGPYLLT